MHYTKLFSRTGMAIIACAISFTSCNKDDAGLSGDDNFGDAQARTEQTFSDLQPLTDEANAMAKSAQSGGQGIGNHQFLSSCATISVDSISVPHVMTIDFGSTNCMGNDGRNRRGKIIVTYSGDDFRAQGHTRTITFDEFYVNDNQVTGTKKITNMGKNGEGHTYFNIETNGSMVTEKGTITHNSNRVRTWISGEDTEAREDDVFSITGSGSRMLDNGKSFTMEIVSPIIRANDCKWIKSGVIKMTGPDNKERSIDFGNGDCDNKATVSFKGKTKEITLR